MDRVSDSLRHNTTIIPPRGWTTDKKQIDLFYSWGDNGRDSRVAKAHGLKSPQPIMCGTPESGHCMCMFHSGSKYYIWDPIEGAIWEIVTEMDLVDIVTEMGKPRSLKTEKIKDWGCVYAMAIMETLNYANSVRDRAPTPEAFWLDIQCQPYRKYIEEEDKVEEVTDKDEQKFLTDQDVYTMSDIIRGAEHTIVIARNATPEPADDPKTQTEALQGWGRRVWTLPEVILSKGDSVTTAINLGQRSRVSKVRLAETAWPDAGYSRQLVEHFTNLPLSRLELVSVAMKCLDKRQFPGKYRGDRSYALMGLLRVRPRIDTNDSSFQAFARLSLPQDNDRLMERLICLLPKDPDEPWNRMSDQYKSTLWDIIPQTQVCGIGENDTVIVDGFKGAMIQWSRFSTVHTSNRMSWKRRILIYVTIVTPSLFIGGFIALATSRIAGIVMLLVTSIVLLAAPVYVPYLYTGKLYEVDPCLFGIEGMGRLKWSPYGSPLSRHRYRACYQEHILEDIEAGAEQPLLNTAVKESRDPVCAYPVEAVDPCSPCDNCINLPPTSECTHVRYSSAEAMSKSPYGSMKLFTLIDTFSMTATLFKARRPPVALIIGGSEGGMKWALACSYDITTGTLYRETVLRLPSQIVDKMHSLQRVRLGLKNPFGASDVSLVNNTQPVSPVAVADPPPQTYQSQTEQWRRQFPHEEDGEELEPIPVGSVWVTTRRFVQAPGGEAAI